MDLAQVVAGAVLAGGGVVGAVRADRVAAGVVTDVERARRLERRAAARRSGVTTTSLVAVNDRRTSTRWNGSVSRMCSGPAR